MDGVIGYPPACSFDPAELLCKSGQKSGCLSRVQVEAARKVYSGPVTSKGEKLYYPAMPGSEKGGFWVADPSYKTHWWRYVGFLPDPGRSWKATDFNFDADYKRLGMMDAIVVGWGNPDLRKFKAAGGKLIIAPGWDDSGSPLPLQTIDYYEMVERVMGGREATQEFARLFISPSSPAPAPSTPA